MNECKEEDRSLEVDELIKIYKKINSSKKERKRNKKDKIFKFLKPFYKILLFIIITFVIFLIISNFFKIKLKKNIFQKGVGMCTLIKDEELYIKEFVDHYIKIGIRKIILYDNNNINSPGYSKILEKEVKSGKIQIINYRGIELPLLKSYKDCYKKFKNKFDWIIFFDTDEFLYINNDEAIEEFLSNKRFRGCDVVKINWLIYNDNDLVHFENKPVLERFKIPLDKIKDNIHIKSIVKGNLKNVKWTLSSHSPDDNKKQLISCNAMGERKIVGPFNNNFKENHKLAYLKHFFTKSTEEYCKKILKGRPTYRKTHDVFYLRLIYYFTLSKFTEEKLDLFISCLGKDFTDYDEIRKKYKKE